MIAFAPLTASGPIESHWSRFFFFFFFSLSREAAAHQGRRKHLTAGLNPCQNLRSGQPEHCLGF